MPPGEFDGENMASIQGLAGWYSLIEEGKKKGEFPEDLPSINLQINPHHIKRGMAYIVGAHPSSFKKDDTIALITITWPDVPVTEDSGWGMHVVAEDMNESWRKPLNGPRFQSIFGVPYRSLIPKGFDGILVAGQTISMTYMAHEPGPCRGMVPIMHWGQAAGTAAAIASKDRISPRQVDIAGLRKTLESQGVNLQKDAVDLSDVMKRFEVPGSKVIISHKA